MDKVIIERLNISELTKFFNLYKSIATTDFKLWDPASKEKWFTDDYSIDYWKQGIIENKLPILVARIGEKLVGYVMLEVINFGVGYLGWIGILKDYQNKQIGSSLLGAIEEWCRGNGIHKIELETQEKELKHFYEMNGFVLEGVKKNSWQHLDNYMFGKELS